MSEMDGSERPSKFIVGEKCKWVVGWPGPDMDDCEIVSDNGDGTYVVRFQCWGKGPFHESVGHTNPGIVPEALRRISKIRSTKRG